jgi:hypothetical protein
VGNPTEERTAGIRGRFGERIKHEPQCERVARGDGIEDITGNVCEIANSERNREVPPSTGDADDTCHEYGRQCEQERVGQRLSRGEDGNPPRERLVDDIRELRAEEQNQYRRVARWTACNPSPRE